VLKIERAKVRNIIVTKRTNDKVWRCFFNWNWILVL